MRLTKEQKDSLSAIIICLFIGWIFLIIASYQFPTIGVHEPGNIFEAREYDLKVKAYINTNDESVKQYLVPVDVSRIDGVYYVRTLYWPNGGSINFDDCYTNSFEETAKCSNSSDDAYTDYNIQLTDQ